MIATAMTLNFDLLLATMLQVPVLIKASMMAATVVMVLFKIDYGIVSVLI